MKNQKMEKIKKAIPLFLVTIIILSVVTQESVAEENKFEEIKNEKGVVPPQYFIIAFGACKKVLINGEENAWWDLEGNLTIFNEHVFGSNENYHILLSGPFGIITHFKYNLPKEFTLEGFSGFGKIKWIDFPHSPCTYFWLFGTAEYMYPEA